MKAIIDPNHDLNNPDLDLGSFSDKDLYHLCQSYGNGIKFLRRIFAVLLVEVNRRGLHRKYGFEGIYEFAAKVGCMNKQIVDQILWLEKALRDKPFLWRSFKTEGWSKVRVVASVATVETDKLWAEKVEILSKPALEEVVKDFKRKQDSIQTNVFDNFPKNEVETTGLASNKPEINVVPTFREVIFVKMRFKVSQETEFRFLVFKQKLCKKKKEALTSGEVLAVLLDGVEGK